MYSKRIHSNTRLKEKSGRKGYHENKREKKKRREEKRKREEIREEKRKNRKNVNYPSCQKFKEMKRNFGKMSRIRIK